MTDTKHSTTLSGYNRALKKALPSFFNDGLPVNAWGTPLKLLDWKIRAIWRYINLPRGSAFYHHASRYPFTTILGLLLVLLASASGALAQEELVRVSIQPDKTEWDWEAYAARPAERLAYAIESRVLEGLPRREFVRDSTAVTLAFRFRVDSRGDLVHFARLAPRRRYLTYLIRRTVRETYMFDPLPEDFPLFYFDGTVTVTCFFRPTGRYKRFYFEQPLDSLVNVDEIFILKPLSTQPLLLHEPKDMDKNALLEQYKKNIGLQEPISDTSSYTPLSFDGRRVAVYSAYDSLTGGTYQTDILRREIILELSEAGAITSDLEYTPEEPDSTEEKSLSASGADTAGAPEDEPSRADSLPAKAPQSGDSLVYHRDLRAAFATVFRSDFLVFSIGLSPGDTPDSAVCRLRLFPSVRPDAIKRNLEIKFAYQYALPEDLGPSLIKRLTDPPPKPTPPAPPAPVATAADSTAPAAVDSLAADTTAAADSTAPAAVDSLASDTTAAATDSASAADTTTVVTGDSLKSAPATPAAAPEAGDSAAALADSAASGAPDDTTKTLQPEAETDTTAALPGVGQASPAPETSPAPDSSSGAPGN